MDDKEEFGRVRTNLMKVLRAKHGRIEFKNNPTTFTIILPKSFDTTKQEKND